MAWLPWNKDNSRNENDRQDQLAALEAHFPKARKTSQAGQPNSCRYDILFTHGTTSHMDVTLRVFIPPSFPEGPPVLQLMQKLQHPWVNQYNQVTEHPFLAQNRWSRSTSLAKLVLEVVRELGTPGPTGGGGGGGGSSGSGGGGGGGGGGYRDIPAGTVNRGGGAGGAAGPGIPPPPMLGPAVPPPAYDAVGGAAPHLSMGSMPSSSSQASSAGSSSSSSSSSSSGSAAAAGSSNSGPPKWLPGMEIPDSFPVYESMNELQLTRLAADDVAFSAHMSNIPEVLEWKQKRDAAIKRNFDLAQKTLERRDELETLRAETLALQEQLLERKAEYEGKIAAELAREGDRSSDAAVLKGLRAAAAEADDASEEVSERFCSGQMSMADFEEQFKELRRSYHRHDALVEFSHLWRER